MLNRHNALSSEDWTEINTERRKRAILTGVEIED